MARDSLMAGLAVGAAVTIFVVAAARHDRNEVPDPAELRRARKLAKRLDRIKV